MSVPHATDCNTRTKRRSSFRLAISLARSSLDIPAVDFEAGSESVGRGGGDATGAPRALALGDTADGLLDFRAWVCVCGWGVSERKRGRGDVGMGEGLASASMAPHSSSTRYQGRSTRDAAQAHTSTYPLGNLGAKHQSQGQPPR